MTEIWHLFLFSITAQLFWVTQGQENIENDYESLINFHWKGNFTSSSYIIKAFPDMEKLPPSRNLTITLIVFKTADENNIEKDLPTDLKIIPLSEPVSYPSIYLVDELEANSSFVYFFFFHKLINLNDLKNSKQEMDSFFKNFARPRNLLYLLKTPGPEFSPFSFSFGVSSCARSGSESNIFREIHDLHPSILFFLHTGDLHYLDIEVDDIAVFEKAYELVFSSKTQKYFFERVPLEYVWDDHDFGANDADGLSKSREAATKSYHKFVPHRNLRNWNFPNDTSPFPPSGFELNSSFPDPPPGNFGIYRSFAVGRVYVIILDLRSFRGLSNSRSILGDNQYEWLQQQLFYVSENHLNKIKQVFLISSVPWIGEGIDWSDYNHVRVEIANLINIYLLQKDIKVMLISGDAHMLAFDTGINNKYGGFPVLNSASLDQTGSCKGGPFTHGPFPGRDDYSIITIQDDSTDRLCVKVQGFRKGAVLIEYDSCASCANGTENCNSDSSYANVCPLSFKTELIIGCSVIVALIFIFVLIYLCVSLIISRAFNPPIPIITIPIPSIIEGESMDLKEDDQLNSYARREVLYTDMVDPKKNKTFQTSNNFNNESQETFIDDLKSRKNLRTENLQDEKQKYSRFSERKINTPEN